MARNWWIYIVLSVLLGVLFLLSVKELFYSATTAIKRSSGIDLPHLPLPSTNTSQQPTRLPIPDDAYNLSLNPHIPISEKHIASKRSPPKTNKRGPSRGPSLSIPTKPAPPNGMIDYTAPNEVKFPEQFNVDVALTRSPPKAIPVAPRTATEKNALGLPADSPLTNQPINATALMNVELSSLDPGAFTVQPAESKPKQLPENGHAEWHWVVTPNQTGEKHLRLHWQSIRILPNGTLEPPEDLGTAFATITVNVEPFKERAIPEFEKLVSENWKAILKYFLPSSGVVLIAWVWAKLRGKKAPSLLPKEGEEKKEEEDKDEETD
jgi:hypothetical protein